MSKREDPKHNQLGNSGAPAPVVVRKLPSARRLLAASIGVATIQFIGGCKGGGAAVANLMVPPNVPVAGQGQHADPQQGFDGKASDPQLGSAGNYVANLMAPPILPPAGASGRRGEAGVSGNAGSGGASGTHAADTDAGTDRDAGHA